jgi:hypothetical protein
MYYKDVATPLFPMFFPQKAEKVGASMYLKAGHFFLDMPINTSHPIFDDFLNDTELITWVGGPALILPDNPDRTVDVLAHYPAEEIHETTPIYAWKYTGGIRGILKAFLEGIKSGSTTNPLIYPIYYATDWEKTDKIIDLNFSNKPCMTAEVYPNKNQARIVLNGPHPEYPVVWGSTYEEAEDTNDNNFADLYRWNYTSNVSFPHVWIVRRQVAWAAKVPDNDLPPVYGPSQISDISPYEQSSNFTIFGVCNDDDTFDGKVSLDLFYRYSDNNSNWSPWQLYGTDVDDNDGWSWEFNSPCEKGYYQFYSLRHVECEFESLDETAPPGPDAIARVVDK